MFDTETTINHYQNLKIGYFKIYQEGYIQHEGLVYTPNTLTDKEIKVVKDYSNKTNIALYNHDEFIDSVFYPEVFRLRTLCIGFNLPFDISRIAKDTGISRGKNKGGFTFTLS